MSRAREAAARGRGRGVRLGLGLAGLALVLALPAGLVFWFDGLPLSGPAETLALVIGLPLLLLLHPWFLARPWVVKLVAVLLLIKLALVWVTPMEGLGVRVYADDAARAAGAWERTYQSLWRPGVSALLQGAWPTREHFPIEWINRIDDFAQRMKPDRPRHQVRPWLEVEGWLRMPLQAGLALAVPGMSEGRVTATDAQGRDWEVPLLTDRAAGTKLDVDQCPQGRLHVKGWLRMQPITAPQWGLHPLMVRSGHRCDPLPPAIMWAQPAGGRISSERIALARLLALACTLGLLALAGAWWLAALGRWWGRGVLTWDLALVALLGLVLPWLWRQTPTWEFMAPVRGLGISLGLLVLLALRPSQAQAWGSRLSLVVLFALGPGLLLEFGLKWWPDLGRMDFFPTGSDMLSYQNFGREIFVGGDFWQQRIKVLHCQPLYRYLAGGLHALFGQALFAQRMLDIWSVLAGAGLAAWLAGRLGARPWLALLAAWLIVVRVLGDMFLNLLGVGLQEYAAMLFMMLAAWAAAQTQGRLMVAAGAGLLAALAFWLRMDHLGVLAGLGLFMLGSDPGSTLSQAWRGLFQGLRRLWRPLLIYEGLLALAVGLVLSRNFVLGGKITLSTPANFGYLAMKTWRDSLSSVGMVLDAGEKGAGLTGQMQWLGFLLGVAALLWRPAFLRRYPLALGLGLCALLAPYLFFRATIYFPRWSIHLLPLAMLSLVLAWEGLVSWPRFRAWVGLR